MKLNGFELLMHFTFYRDGEWFDIPKDCFTDKGFDYRRDGAVYRANFFEKEEGLFYRLSMKAPFLTKMKMEIELKGEVDYFHLIPCNIYGNNNAEEAKPGEFPILTEKYQGQQFCSPYWEFRADRASMPVSMLCCEKGTVGISVDPYSETSGGTIHNGVFAKLPSSCGITLGYTNLPVTVTNKRTPELSKGDSAYQAEAEGEIYAIAGRGRLEAHNILRLEYNKRHERAVYEKTYEAAAKGMLDAFVNVNWDETEKEYTNKSCRIPDNSKLRPWRVVPEIGWTGGGILAYPLIMCRYLLDDVSYGNALPGEGIISRIIESFHEESGLFYDLTRLADDGSRVNGWWTGYGLVKDCHCAYNVGSALHYILKTIIFLREQGIAYPQEWLSVSRKVMDTVVGLQREDGAFGYTYSTEKCEVTDWEGFAGCWFAPCAAYFYELDKNQKYIEAAKKALRYYGKFVKELNCWGAPMDTWKSVDEEGNLAFVRGCRLVHEYSGDEEFLELLKDGASYEYLWRYGYRTKPDHAPIKEGWNSCGGSVTSVSNPHIHPMGVIIDQDLLYLAKATGDDYHKQRSEDGTAWLMQTLELYPEKTGYGVYGILSERWCPSDGLTVERYSDGRPYSSWFSYNLWAAANALEAICEKIRTEKIRTEMKEK